MKKITGFTAILTIILLVFILSCQKEMARRAPENAFDASFVKEWYYGTFKKSAEWASSAQKGKKLPDWKHPIVGKIAGHDVIEFPLVEASKNFALPSSLNLADRQRLAGASISRIQFIRGTAPSDIRVREVDYIPDAEYARGKGYDISDQSVVQNNTDFTGTLVVKKWNGESLGLAEFKEGKFEKKGTILKGSLGNRPQTETCTVTEFCIIQQDCILYIYADGMTSNECSEWYNTGECWETEYCTGSEGDICELFNICEDGGGFETECNRDCAEASAILAAITSQDLNEVEMNAGTASAPDPDGIIRKPVSPIWKFLRLNLGLGYFAEYSAFYSGVVFKTNSNATSWKWESLTFGNARRSAGNNPPCISTTLETTPASVIISPDKSDATHSLSYSVSVTAPCALGAEVNSYSNSGFQHFNPNW